jgi:hypothetical protein
MARSSGMSIGPERVLEPPRSTMLEATTVEIEAYVADAGWDRAPSLFALVPTHLVPPAPLHAASEAQRGPVEHGITPVLQEQVPDVALDELLAGIGWPDEVIGCAVSQEIVMLPPSAEAEVGQLPDTAAIALAGRHPARQEARLVVAVLRDGHVASVLRLRGRGADSNSDELLTGPDLAPNLAAALRATLAD